MKVVATLSLALLTLATAPSVARPEGGGDLKERVAALKQSLAQSQQALRAYQWIETTTVSLKGEQKSMKQASCVYGADGKVQKTPLASSPPPKKKGGLRGKIAAEKKEEMTETMQQAVGLVKTYVPPNPALIQRAADAGKVSLEVVQPGKVARLVIRDYELPGDSLSLTVDPATNRLLGIAVATYLGKPGNPVTLNATMASLADGTSYTSNTRLSLPADKLDVDVTNAGYRKM